MQILLVKLGALGDVLRTTPLLTALKKKYAAAQLHWVVDNACADVLVGNPLIDVLSVFSEAKLAELKNISFDLAINLDKDKEALDTIMAVHAKTKMGFGRDVKGALCALDFKSDYAYRLGVDDELKFKQNKKTYQAISFEQAGLVFSGEDYILPLGPQKKSHAKELLKKIGADPDSAKRPVVGLNTGSGRRFAGKRLPVKSWVRLAERFHNELGMDVWLLGGQDEIERNQEIQKNSRVPMINTGSHDILTFAAMVSYCDLVISGDTTAMHIAIAVKTPVIAYFASTCATEIELYGRGQKIISDISCAPCYLKDCPIDERCMDEMNMDAIFQAAKSHVEGIRTT